MLFRIKRRYKWKRYGKTLNGYEELYQVSNLGRVKSFYTHKILKPQMQKNGYLVVNLKLNGVQSKKLIHRLVALAFIPNQKDKHYINHKDGNKQNNKVDNLEWCTQSENIKYAYENKTKYPPNQKAIKQYDLDGTYINVFDSIQEAFRLTGICATNISKCCRGQRKKAGGFIWKYVE